MTTFIIFGWLALLLILWVWQHELLRRTWREPYFAVPPVVIESDDWGPGGEHHAERLRQLLRMLARHRDCRGQPAILTANIVLAVPDTKAICANGYSDIVRRWLDTDFPDILEVMREGQDNRTFDPQLHGLEHLHTPGLMRLAREGDGEARRIFDEPDWWDWESLSSPRQAHYVDGTQLPTVPLNREDRVATVDEAIRVFQRCFGFAPRSTVAPCYLWDAEVEDIWRDVGILTIQTLGYRCPERDAQGSYRRDLDLLRPGDRAASGHVYSVRNILYEPVDGKGVSLGRRQIRSALWQALPIVFTTHRYNFTRSLAEHECAVTGLDDLLNHLGRLAPRRCFMGSDQLGDWLRGPPLATQWIGIWKLPAFLARLFIRHRKLRLGVMITGLVLPIGLTAVLVAAARLVSHQYNAPYPNGRDGS